MFIGILPIFFKPITLFMGVDPAQPGADESRAKQQPPAVSMASEQIADLASDGYIFRMHVQLCQECIAWKNLS